MTRTFKVLYAFILAVLLNISCAQMTYPVESYQVCTAEQRAAINCGMHANCVIYNGTPGCACIVDQITGLPMTGNPYTAGCTYDMSGVWQLFEATDVTTGKRKAVISPMSNEPFIIQLDRTDAILKTKYILGAIFAVGALTAFAVGVCSKFILSIDDNNSVIMETAQGYMGDKGKSILLRTPRQDTVLIKERTNTMFFNSMDLTGLWRKESGSRVDIVTGTAPRDLTSFWSKSTLPFTSFSYQDSSWNYNALDETMGIWVDNGIAALTNQGMVGISTDAKFVQTGFFGNMRFGSRRIDVFSILNGNNTYTLYQLDPGALPAQLTLLSSTPAFPSENYGVIGTDNNNAAITTDYSISAQAVSSRPTSVGSTSTGYALNANASEITTTTTTTRGVAQVSTTTTAPSMNATNIRGTSVGGLFDWAN